MVTWCNIDEYREATRINRRDRSCHMLLLFCTRLVNISLKKISKGNSVFIQVPVLDVVFAFFKSFSNGNVCYIQFVIFADH